MKTNLQAIASLICILTLSGCATRPTAQQIQSQKNDYAWKRADGVPLDQRPALFAQMEQAGEITHAKREEWDRWVVSAKEAQKQKADRDKWMASLTPRERLALEMQKRAIDAQREQQQSAMAYQAEQQQLAQQQARRQAIGAALGAVNNQLQAQQAAQTASTEAYREQLLRSTRPAPTPVSYRAVSHQEYPGGPVETTIQPY